MEKDVKITLYFFSGLYALMSLVFFFLTPAGWIFSQFEKVQLGFTYMFMAAVILAASHPMVLKYVIASWKWIIIVLLAIVASNYLCWGIGWVLAKLIVG